jgi:ferredoxin
MLAFRKAGRDAQEVGKMPRRQIIHIDQDLCTGCGECVPACAEGALEIVDGKVRVVEEVLCDGLGACLGECPVGALSVEEREAPEFDQAAVERRLGAMGGPALAAPSLPTASPAVSAAPGVHGGGCPGALSRLLRDAPPASTAAPGPSGAGNGSARPGAAPSEAPPAARADESLLGHWPVQLGLVNPLAPFLRGSDLLIAADCVPVAYRRFHEDFLEGRSVVIACPKLDDAGAHLATLTDLFMAARPRSVTVVHMEVPCCFGLVSLVSRAAEAAGLEAPVQEVVISVDGRRAEVPVRV